MCSRHAPGRARDVGQWGVQDVLAGGQRRHLYGQRTVRETVRLRRCRPGNDRQ